MSNSQNFFEIIPEEIIVQIFESLNVENSKDSKNLLLICKTFKKIQYKNVFNLKNSHFAKPFFPIQIKMNLEEEEGKIDEFTLIEVFENDKIIGYAKKISVHWNGYLHTKNTFWSNVQNEYTVNDYFNKEKEILCIKAKYKNVPNLVTYYNPYTHIIGWDHALTLTTLNQKHLEKYVPLETVINEIKFMHFLATNYSII